MTALADIARLAAAATPGPWQDEFVCGPSLRDIRTGDDDDALVATSVGYLDAAFISACSPEVMVAFVGVAEELTAQHAEHYGSMPRGACHGCYLLDALTAALEATR